MPGPTAPTRARRPAPGRRRGLLATALAAGVAAALGLAPAAVAQSPAPSGTSSGKVTFTVGILNDIDSLNPFTGIVAEAYEAYGMMYDQLTGYSQEDFSPIPQLAEKWEESPDGKTWTYTLRANAKWSDGKPVTANDVVYTFNRIKNGSYEQTNYGSYVANIETVTAKDDRTVVMTTTGPSPIMLRLAVPILPEHVWKNVGPGQVQSFANEKDVVGSGPFTLTERKTGQFVRFTANKAYWDGAPQVDEVVFRVFNNTDALIQAMRNGEVDFADNLDADPWKALKKVPGITTYAAKYSGFNEIAFNTGAALDDGTLIGDGHPFLVDGRVRRALSQAIDTQELVDRVLNGSGTPGTTVIPPIYEDLHLKPAGVRPFDIDAANAALDAAGYKRGAQGRRMMPGEVAPIILRLYARQESTTSQRSAQFVQSWFNKLGLTVNVRIVAEDTLTELVGQGNFDMFEWGWVVEPDPDYQLSTFTCDKRSYQEGGSTLANLSDSFYCDRTYDRLYAQQATETDPAERAEIVKEMQQRLYDDAPYAVTFYYDNLQAYSNEFTGFVAQPPPDGVLLFQYGTFSYRNVRPVSADDEESGDGLPLGLIGGVTAAVGVAGVLGAVLLRRRRGDAMDTE
jgi:peptide/nickel transport system substrate-binding protein